MANEQVNESLRRADRWSKIAALFVAIGVFLGASALTENTTINASIAAFVGIGVRIYIPYQASIVTEGAAPSQALTETGNYHHGAVGAGLVVGALAALVATVVNLGVYLALGVGVGVGLLAFLVLRVVLPS